MSRFEKYKELKTKLDFVYKGIHLNRVCALLIWSLANDTTYSWFGWKHVAFAFLAFDVSKLRTDGETCSIVSTFGRYHRKDHWELYNNILSKLSGEKLLSTNILTWKYKVSIHPVVIWRVFSFIFCAKGIALSFVDKWKLALYYSLYCNTLLELDKLHFNGVKKYLCQCSVLDLENLLTQYMRLRGITTYSLQEGMYQVFKIDPPMDSVQYENFETDNLLCWGQFTIDEDISYGISSERLKLAGYPKNVKMELMKADNPLKKCMILVARDTYRQSNIKLLSILSAHTDKYEFCLKLHPSCDYDFYLQYAEEHSMNIIPKENTVDECLDKELFDFAIAVNTTAYYEALMRGLPCLRYWDKTFDLAAGYKDVFETTEEFVECLNRIKKISQEEYQKAIDETLRYAIGVGVDNYCRIVCEE